MNASLQHISFLVPSTTTASSQPKHPKTTVPYHFALPKCISNPFPTLGKHKKCINITVSIWRKDKKCINVTVSVWRLYKKPFSIMIMLSYLKGKLQRMTYILSAVYKIDQIGTHHCRYRNQCIYKIIRFIPDQQENKQQGD